MLQVSLPDPPERRGGARVPRTGRSSTGAQRKKAWRQRRQAERKKYLAVLDMETDPFDYQLGNYVFPFLAVLYSDQFEPVIIWESDHDRLCARIISAIEALPHSFTIYAHNGGRFDFLFLISRLRGDVKFKGRGIMCARIGTHELRDSFHIIPEKLAAFQKDTFDYKNMASSRREKFKAEIIRYCVADCRYLFDIVQTFVEQFGFKISIGQAAMYEIRQHYDVARLTPGMDAYLRPFYFGGRVQCFKGRGNFKGSYKLIDVNSLYPFVMATRLHPIGGLDDYDFRAGPVREDTVFLTLRCKNNGAFLSRLDTGETVATVKHGVFNTTIHEFEVATRYNLISDVEIIETINCPRVSNFSKFVEPMYANRLETKATLARLEAAGLRDSEKFIETKKDDIFYKLLLNNGYGKFCQDPRRYKEHFITDPHNQPPWEWWRSIYDYPDEIAHEYKQPIFECDKYWIWNKPNPGFRYNNVGTGASITGAARAVLLEALQHAKGVIYCDTDSIICQNFDTSKIRVDKTALGAWDLEDEFSQVVIAGKKLYSVWHVKAKKRTQEELEKGASPWYTIKSKGTAGMTWENMLELLEGKTIEVPNKAPTITKFSTQYYLRRNIRATAPEMEATP